MSLGIVLQNEFASTSGAKASTSDWTGPKVAPPSIEVATQIWLTVKS